MITTQHIYEWQKAIIRAQTSIIKADSYLNGALQRLRNSAANNFIVSKKPILTRVK